MLEHGTQVAGATGVRQEGGLGMQVDHHQQHASKQISQTGLGQPLIGPVGIMLEGAKV